MSKLLAPNGKPSKLTLEQYKLVRTPAFKKWFGDWEKDTKNASKVVDENGEPLVVYHGTPQKNKFYDFKIVEGSDKKSKMQLLFGSHFASNLEDAKIYSKEKGNIYEVFLNIRNILDLEEYYERSNPKFNNILEIIKELKLDKKFKNSLDYVLFTDDGDYGGLSNDIQRVFLTQQMLDSYPPKKVFDILKNKYNGIHYTPYQPQGFNTISNFSKSYIVFDNKNIKLADGTNTIFDSNNPDIRFYEGGISTGGAIGGEIELKLDEEYKKLMNDENNFPFNILNEKGEIIGRIELIYREDLGGYQIYSSKVKEKGKGIGKKAYIKLRHILGKPIISDSSRTEDAENLWKSLERNNLSFFDEKIDKYKMYETGGSISNTNIIAQVWGWFGIKF